MVLVRKTYAAVRLLRRWLASVQRHGFPEAAFASIALFLLVPVFSEQTVKAAEAQAPQPSAAELARLLKEMTSGEVPSVYSASKQKEKVSDSPASISIISTNDIASYGYRTLADILASV